MTFKMYITAIEVELFLNRKHNIVMDSVMTLCASDQVLCNVQSYHFSDMHYPLNNSYDI